MKLCFAEFPASIGHCERSLRGEIRMSTGCNGAGNLISRVHVGVSTDLFLFRVFVIENVQRNVRLRALVTESQFSDSVLFIAITVSHARSVVAMVMAVAL